MALKHRLMPFHQHQARDDAQDSKHQRAVLHPLTYRN
jgi:hypothetical protein